MDDTTPPSPSRSHATKSAADVPAVVFTPAITPENLGALLRNEKVSQPIRVRGYVTDLQLCESGSARYWHGRLVLDDSAIAFRVQADTALAEGEPVVIVGVLHVDSKGHALELRGHFESAWRPSSRTPAVFIPPRRHARLSLAEFVRQHSVTALGFLATKTGWDAISTIAAMSQLAQCHRVFMPFTGEDKLIESITLLARLPTIKGIVVARGAGEKLASMGNSLRLAKTLVETGLPLYVALGQAGNVLLLDKHADESFVGPADFASRLRECERENVERQNADMIVQQLRTELTDLRQAMRAAEVQHEESLRGLRAQHAKAGRLRRRKMIVMALLVVLGVLLWELL